MKLALPHAAALLLAFVVPVEAGQRATFKPVITEVGKESVTVKTGANAGYRITGVGDNGLPTRLPPANVEIYTVNRWTKITLNGKPAKLGDLKNGMEVRVSMSVDRKIAATVAAKQPY